MRADRLVAALLLMQARGSITARELADELEISVATARRDLEALSSAGIPVYPQRGRGGGWTLLGGARTDLSGLSFPEMQALFTLAGPAATANPDARSALRKLVRALPETFRAQAEAAGAAVIVDTARWGHRPSAPPDVLEALRDAVVARSTIRLAYRDRPVHDVEPWGLIDKGGVWYLVAGTPRGRRTFRVDRVTSAEATGALFDPPAGFDLTAAWDEITAELERRRSGVVAEVSAPAALVGPLRDVLGARHVVDAGAGGGDPADTAGGRRRLRISANTVEMLARQLAGWAPEVDVLGPPEVRNALGVLGAELAERYAARTVEA